MQTLAFEKTSARSHTLARIGWISGFALLTGVAALVKIPLLFTPVPMTLQTAVVLASGVVLGKDGVYSQLLYVLLGGIGLPFFVGETAGFTYLFGATGGYLLGFIATSALVGRWLQPVWSELSYTKRTAGLLAASLLVFIPGVLQLKLALDISFVQALALGFVPFIAGDILKTALVALTPSKIVRR